MVTGVSSEEDQVLPSFARDILTSTTAILIWSVLLKNRPSHGSRLMDFSSRHALPAARHVSSSIFMMAECMRPFGPGEICITR